MDGASGAGIAGDSFTSLTAKSCRVTQCAGNGLHLGKGSVLIEDCTFSNNELNGGVLGSSAEGWCFDRCTFSRNGQYGVWANGGARVQWKQNTLSSNVLGEKGGKGLLEGWLEGRWFRPGDSCAVWDEILFEWLPGVVLDVTQDSVTVRAERSKVLKKKEKTEVQPTQIAPLKRVCKKSPSFDIRCTEPSSSEGQNVVTLTVSPDALRQPLSGDRGVPEWSAKSQSTPLSRAYSLFLREGGAGKEAWNTMPERARAYFQRASKGETSKAKDVQARSKADGDRKRRLAVSAVLGLKKKPKH